MHNLNQANLIKATVNRKNLLNRQTYQRATTATTNKKVIIKDKTKSTNIPTVDQGESFGSNAPSEKNNFIALKPTMMFQTSETGSLEITHRRIHTPSQFSNSIKSPDRIPLPTKRSNILFSPELQMDQSFRRSRLNHFRTRKTTPTTNLNKHTLNPKNIQVTSLTRFINNDNS